MKVGLVLEGGGLRSIYTAGVLDIFMENDITINGIIGVSAGALFGLNYKSHQINRAIRYNRKYINDRRYMGLYSLITTGDIMNKDFCFNKLVNELDPIDFETYKNSVVDFFAVVTNIDSGKPEYIKIDDLRKHEQIEYLRASGSLPIVSKIVKIEGNKYLDGGISDSIPVKKMLEMGYDKIIVIPTRPITYRKKRSTCILERIIYHRYPNLIKTIENRYKIYNKEVEKIIELENMGQIMVIRPTKNIKIKRIEKDIKRIEEMYELGKSDTINIIDKIKEFLTK